MPSPTHGGAAAPRPDHVLHRKDSRAKPTTHPARRPARRTHRGRTGRHRTDRPARVRRRSGTRPRTDRQRHLRQRSRPLVGDRQPHPRLAAAGGSAPTYPAAPSTRGTSSSARTTSRWSPVRRTSSGSSAPPPPAKVGKALIQLPVDPYTQYLSVEPRAERLRQRLHATPSPRRSTCPTRRSRSRLGGSADPWRFCLDNVSLRGGAAPEVYVPDTGPRVRVNQVGYLPDGAEERHRRHRRDRRRCPGSCENAAGGVGGHAARPRRAALDASSGQNVHSIDFGRVRQRGHRLHPGRRRRDQPAVRHRRRLLRAAARRRAEVLLHPAQRHRDPRRAAPRLRPPGRSRRRRAQPGRHRACPASPASATTPWTSPAAGTTPATTASTSSTAASPCTS